ncbi:MAG: hypothetical protein A2Y12_15995 [Planctomycetes bacterium GWF2_42_9]|nr:MAG: hypothetical protein A2Y12_15995 [Planctomycetes bacterium GWF2_42_9]
MDIRAFNEINERIETAKSQLANCNLCPRRCGVNRLKGQTGYCGLDSKLHVFKELIFKGEESILNPSHLVYFTGCNIRCEFCVVGEWNNEPMTIEEVNFHKLSNTIVQRQKEGAKWLNLLGGEVCVNLYGILQLLSNLDRKIKVVWNSNMFYNDFVDKSISGLIDIYLADLKCGNSECAEKLLGSAQYPMAAKMNILKAYKTTDIIVRHVILPGHRKCCLEPILKWVAAEIPDVKFSLRGYYVPPIPAVHSPKEYLSKEELQSAIALAKDMGLRLIQ